MRHEHRAQGRKEKGKGKGKGKAVADDLGQCEVVLVVLEVPSGCSFRLKVRD